MAFGVGWLCTWPARGMATACTHKCCEGGCWPAAPPLEQCLLRSRVVLPGAVFDRCACSWRGCGMRRLAQGRADVWRAAGAWFWVLECKLATDDDGDDNDGDDNSALQRRPRQRGRHSILNPAMHHRISPFAAHKPATRASSRSHGERPPRRSRPNKHAHARAAATWARHMLVQQAGTSACRPQEPTRRPDASPQGSEPRHTRGGRKGGRNTGGINYSELLYTQ